MLTIKNIDVFMGRKKIIKDISFQVANGAIVGLIGPNGAGKTTIMKTILGLTKFNGEIRVNNEIVTENNHRALAKVGALIEHPAIYPFLSGTQNLELYSKDRVAMTQIITLLKMDDYINQKSKNYSLGMKQKLGIAIALLNNPELVILDEPMNGLDIEATVLVRQIIKKYASQGTTFVISSHVLNELQKIMTDTVIIKDGELIVDESIDIFKKVNNQSYRLTTKNLEQSYELIKLKGFDVKQSDDHLIVSKESIDLIQDLLFQNRIHLITLIPEEVNFEQTIINLLQEKRGNADGN